MSDNFDVPKVLSGTGGWLDDRFHGARGFRVLMRKVFPDHWSFMLGEIALWSFVILLLTGTFLSFFFVPSTTHVVYHGSYVKLDGIRMSEAYQSTLNISFDVRAGLLMRQIHHWAADLFMVAIIVHMLRVFFTGAYRKPREVNWLIGIVLFTLGLLEGLFGYSLPDDQLSGAGLRILEGVLQGIPIVGTYLAFFLFGGPYPGDIIVPQAVHHPRAADSGPDPGLDHRPPVHHVLAEAHADAGQGEHREERHRPAVLPVFPGQGRRVVLLHLCGARAARHLRPDQPDLAVRAVQSGADLVRVPARLLHGHPGGLAAGDACLGVELPRAHTVPECAHTSVAAVRPNLHRRGVLAVLRAMGHWGQVVPQHQRPAAERPDPHRYRHGDRGVLWHLVGRGRQRRPRRFPADSALHDHLDRARPGIRRTGARVRHH